MLFRSDGKSGVRVIGAVADPPVLGTSAATILGDEIHGIHQVYHRFQVVVNFGVGATAGLPQAVVREMTCIGSFIAEKTVLIRG